MAVVQVKYFAVKQFENHPLEKVGKNKFLTVAGSVIESDNLGHVQEGDRVVGMVIPSPSVFQMSEKHENVIEVPSYYLCKIPSELNPADCVSILEPALGVYTSLYYMSHAKPGNSVLVVAPSDIKLAVIALQICRKAQLKAYTVCFEDSSRNILKEYVETETQVLRLDCYNTNQLAHLTKKETNGKNFDLILDFGQTELNNEEASTNIPFAELLPCLAVMGSIVTTKHSHSLSPRESAILHLKAASLHFLFNQIWLLSPLKLGCYQHILNDVLNKLLVKDLKPLASQTVHVSNFSCDILSDRDSSHSGTIFQIS